MTSQPIFIVGVGRSGSTIFHHVMSRHQNVAWLSTLIDRYPSRPQVNRWLMQGIDWPGVGETLLRRFDPSEAYVYWDRLFPGFSTPCRDLVASDVTNSVKRGIQSGLTSIATRTRNRLLVKLTGWPRIGFLKEIFPDAKFIHVMRDGRPVASSFLRVPWWWGWRGPSNWRWGELSANYRAEWEHHGRSFIALAGIQWKILMEAMESARASIAPEDVLELRYEEICADPVLHFRTAVGFAGLEWNSRFERVVLARGLRSENEKWKAEFTPEQQRVLQEVLRDDLARYGYT